MGGLNMNDYISREVMSEAPKCPGCGADMELMYLCKDAFCYACMKCGWDSPVGIDSESAFRMAMRRAEPKNRVLTLEELKVYTVFLWSENRYSSFDYEGEPAFVEEGFMYTGDGNVDLRQDISDAYGKIWRCWLRKPTEAKRWGTPWAGDSHE